MFKQALTVKKIMLVKLSDVIFVTLFTLAVIPVAFANTQQVEVSAAASNSATNKAQCLPFLDRKVRQLHKKSTVDLCELTQGKTVLIINTASHCGFTKQFSGLEAIHKKYQPQGLVVLGFPSDDFFQEEDDEADTATICFVNYGVTFTMLNTIEVRGSDADPIFKHLANETVSPKWNFYKYLVRADGKKVQHFNSRVSPEDSDFIQAIETALTHQSN